MLAKMASKSVKPKGLKLLLPDEEDAFIRRLPVRCLPGVGPKTETLLQKLNVRTIEEMRALSPESLGRMLGIPGLILHERCRGRDTQPISRREVPRSIRRETSFHTEATDRDTIEGTLHYLTERAANTLRQFRLKAGQLGVRIRYGDFVEENALRKLPSPTQLDSELFLFAVSLLRALHTRRVALRLVGVHLAGLVPASGLEQLEILKLEHPVRSLEARRRERRLLESLDAIRHRYGYAAVVCGRSLHLLGKLPQDDHGFILRTPCLTL
jgi:DNA polymerase-4